MARSYKELKKDLNFNYYPAPEKKYQERVLLVHFFGGNQKLLLRHIRVLNQIGLDVYAFDFSYRKNIVYKQFPKLKNKEYQIQKIWMQELKDVLDYVPGPVVFFSFSGPASCSVHWAAKHPEKVIGLVSDSGPFTHLFKCNFNLAKVEFGLKSKWQRLLFSVFITPLWNTAHTKELLENLANIKEATPYLSIQPVLDEVVPIDYQEDVFARSPHKLKLEVLRLEKSGHLTGLKLQPQKYKQRLENWFSENFKLI